MNSTDEQNPNDILALFDGMSCGQISLNNLCITYDKYYASEVDKFAMKVTNVNFPNTIQLGDINKWKTWNIEWKNIKLILAGSPCQGFSFAGKQLNFNDERSALFFVFVDILNHVKKFNPKVKFLLENVKMKKEYLAIISEYVGVFPVEINSNLLSAQNRKRFYWTNIKTRNLGLFEGELISDIPQPKDKNILLKDILQPDNEINEKYYLSNNMLDYFNKTTEKMKEAGNGFYLNQQKEIKKQIQLPQRKGEEFIIQLPHGSNKGGIRAKDGKVPSITTSSWEQNNLMIKLNKNWNIKPDQNKASCLTGGGNSGGNHSDMDVICFASRGRKNEKGKHIQKYEERNDGKSNSLTTVEKDNMIKLGLIGNRVYSFDSKKGVSLNSGGCPSGIYSDTIKIRRLTPIECERLQTVPDNYTNHVSDTQRYRMLGNGWTIEIISWILNFLKLI